MPDTLTRTQNTVAQSTEFVVVAWSHDSSSDGSKGHYAYFPHATENGAKDDYADIERGEFKNLRAVCIFASRHGVPIGRIA